MPSNLRQIASDLIKDGSGIVFDDDGDREDFEQSILSHGDLDTQVDRLNGSTNATPQNPSAAVKEKEREAFFRERAHRPTQPYNYAGLDPQADVVYIPDIPLAFDKRTHNQIQLLQQNNASEAKLLGMYNSRFK